MELHNVDSFVSVAEHMRFTHVVACSYIVVSLFVHFPVVGHWIISRFGAITSSVAMSNLVL